MSGTDAPDHDRWIAEVERLALAIRQRVLEHVVDNNGGYLSQACSSAEILATLYGRVMRLGPSAAPPIPGPFTGVPGHSRSVPAGSGGRYNGPRDAELDRFFFSPVHYALALYATLVEIGRLDARALEQFNRDGSTVEMIGAEHSPGIETTAGSLAQTLSHAAGVTMARRLKGESGRVWVFLSDGELQEGQTWEALAAASHHRLGRLGVYVDCNGQQCDGPMADVMNVEPVVDRLRAFGAEVIEVDGHDIAALAAAGQRQPTDLPRVVVCRTDPCRGVDQLRQRAAHRIHHLRFDDDAERQAYAAALGGVR